MSIPVVADADTLFGATTRGVLVFLDYRGLIKLHWSPLILDEMSRALVDARRKPTIEAAKLLQQRLGDALPNAMVSVHEVQAQFESVQHAVNSAKDVHVAACAHHLIASNAYPGLEAVVLATRNARDFKQNELARLGIELRSPDEFLHGVFSMSPGDFAFAFRGFRQDLTSKPEPAPLLDALRCDGLVRTAAALRAAHEAGAHRL